MYINNFYILIAVGVVTLLCAIWFLGPRANISNIKNKDSLGKTIVCFGDSITAGYGSSGLSYPDFLQQKISSKVINAGVNGDTTAAALQRIEEDVLNKDPYLVIVELGGNDFLNFVPKERTINHLEEIIQRIQAKGAMVALVEFKAASVGNKYVFDFKNLAREYGVLLIPDALEGVLDNPQLRYNKIHPNEQGYHILAERIYNHIQPLLK